MKVTLVVVKNRVFPSRSEVVVEEAHLGPINDYTQSIIKRLEKPSKYSAVVKAQAFELELPEEFVSEVSEYFNKYPAFDETGRMIFYNKDDENP